MRCKLRGVWRAREYTDHNAHKFSHCLAYINIYLYKNAFKYIYEHACEHSHLYLYRYKDEYADKHFNGHVCQHIYIYRHLHQDAGQYGYRHKYDNSAAHLYQYTRQHADIYRNKDEHSGKHSHEYAHNDSNRHSCRDTDGYARGHTDKYPVKYRNIDGHCHCNFFHDKYAGKYIYQYCCCDLDQHPAGHVDRDACGNADKHAGEYGNNHKFDQPNFDIYRDADMDQNFDIYLHTYHDTVIHAKRNAHSTADKYVHGYAYACTVGPHGYRGCDHISQPRAAEQ